jgi:hypothetical protein
LIATLAALAAGALVAAAAHAAPALRVRGHELVDGPGAGHVVQLRGINRSGLEYACIHGWGFFESPHPARIDDPAMIAAMNSWDINVVRVPLNEDCWLGLATPPEFGGVAYQRIAQQYVRALNAAHLYVILDLHLAAPGSRRSTAIDPMPDGDHAPAFWRSVARTFRHNHALIFDLYNEPHDVGWQCWLAGCAIAADGGYQAAGMQQLVDAVRSTGATQPLLLGGTRWALDLSGWLAHAPRDPRHQLLASDHTYGGLAPCDAGCRAAIAATDRRVPVLFGELGETDCAHAYVDSMMGFADSLGIGYLGWAWDAVAPGGWSCTGGPSLILDYAGTPTAFGVGLRDHLHALGAPARPS